MSAAQTGVGGLFDSVVQAVTGGNLDPANIAASAAAAASARASGLNTWQRWQQIHPGTPYSDYQNWWNQYGQSGGTISGAGVGQDALENALNLVSSRDYTVTRGDSPASIAKKFGVSMDQLLNANPQKSTTVVRGVRTWTDLSINEGLNLPKAGVRVGYVAGVGQAGTADVQWVQRALNKLGEYAQADTDIPPPWPRVDEDGVTGDPTKISIDVYRKVRGLGTGPLTASESWKLRDALAADLHAAAFGEQYSSYGGAWYPDWLKAAMKRALRIFLKNQGSTDAQADVIVAKVESEQKWPWLKAPAGTVNGAGVGDYAVDAVRAASAVDPCARENVRHVCAAQAAMGFRPDGKWGTDTYIAALGFDPQARPGCSPRPAWWPPPGYGACAPQMNEVLVEARKDLAQMEAWKRAREGNGTMSGIRLNGSPIAGHGLGQDPSAAPPPAAPPVGLTPEQAGAQAAGAAADASSKKVIAGHHHHLSMPVKIGIGVGAAAVAAGVVYACTRGKKKGRRRSRR
jgi:hypothetical protein